MEKMVSQDLLAPLASLESLENLDPKEFRYDSYLLANIFSHNTSIHVIEMILIIVGKWLSNLLNEPAFDITVYYTIMICVQQITYFSLSLSLPPSPLPCRVFLETLANLAILVCLEFL